MIYILYQVPGAWCLVSGFIMQGNHHRCAARLAWQPRCQVRELDKFAGGMAAKKKACLDQIEKDRKELAHVTAQLDNEGRK